MAQRITLSFTGLAADQHELPMHQLGKALIGTDRIINSGLISFAYGRLPKRGERFDLVISAQEPKQGSVEIVALLQQAPWILPIVQDFLVSGGVEASFRFFSFVLTKLGGRPAEAQAHLDAITEMNRDNLEARNMSEQQWQGFTINLVDRLAPSARQAIAPIGTAASALTLSADHERLLTKIDEPMADAIRSKEDDEVGDMEKMTIQVDGITHHNRQLKVVHPSVEGKFITAEVRDPNFDSFPNSYTEATSKLSKLSVHAKPLYRNGELYKLYVMDLARD